MSGGSTTLERVPTPTPDAPARAGWSNRRRFAIATLLGALVVTIPYLWVLWDLWSGSLNPLRSVGPSNFYDLQAHAILHGTLALPRGSLGIEAFLHDGRTYTYFGIFPSLLRIPATILFPGHGGTYTALSMLGSWVLTGVFTALVLWRVRVMVRGDELIGRLEAAAYGTLIATVLGGSVLLFLASDPWVYHEDLAWGVALTIGSMYALLEIMARPSRWRIVGAGFLILCANLNRLTTGWGCTIAAVLVAAWFFWSREQRDNRQWAVPVLLAGLIPLVIGCVINYMKFGLFFGLPMADQVWTHVNAHRRYFLAVNGGKAFSPKFLIRTLPTYLNPFGLHFSSLFPYIWLPKAPAVTSGSIVLDQTYASSSIPASMPLLFLLSCWGLITAFRPRPIGSLASTRFILLAAGASTAGVLLWGYIANRYLTDFVPLLIVASCIGLVDICRRLQTQPPPWRTVGFGLIGFLGVVSIVINTALAIGPSNTWLAVQNQHFVKTQGTLSSSAQVHVTSAGATLPYFAPVNHLFIANRCAGLYISSGITFKNSPGQQLQHQTWTPVEQGPGILHEVHFTIKEKVASIHRDIPLVSWGSSTLVIHRTATHWIQLVIRHPSGPRLAFPAASGPWIFVRRGITYGISVATDPYLNSMTVKWQGTNFHSLGYGWIDHYIAGPGPAIVWSTSILANPSAPQVVVHNEPVPVPNMSICTNLEAKLGRAPTLTSRPVDHGGTVSQAAR